MIQQVSRITFPSLFRSGSERTGIGGGDHADGDCRCVVPQKIRKPRIPLASTPITRRMCFNAFLLALTLNGFVIGQELTALPALALDCYPATTTIEVRWNKYASSTGLYEFAGCDGQMPTLHLSIGVEYTFVHQHTDAWYHPVNVAWGALTAEDQEAIAVDPTRCRAIREPEVTYVYGAHGNVSLEEQNEFFSYPLDSWNAICSGGGCATKIQINSAVQSEIYYYCYWHNGMTGRIKLIGAETGIVPYFGSILHSHQVLHAPPNISRWDTACGTWDSQPFSRDGESYDAICENKAFLCDTDNGNALYNECLQAIDCQMHHNMAVSAADNNKIATFVRQMIPHHANAIAMAKVLIKHSSVDDAGSQDEYEQFMSLGQEIINTQNAQIRIMGKWLADYELEAAVTTELCTDSGAAASSQLSVGSIAAVSIAAFVVDALTVVALLASPCLRGRMMRRSANYSASAKSTAATAGVDGPRQDA